MPSAGDGKTARRAAGGSGRITIMVIGLFLVLGVIGGRLVWLQVAKADEFSQAAQKQRTQTVRLEPRRGEILDREGEKLAVSAESRSVYASPVAVGDPAVAAAILARCLGGDPAYYSRKMTPESDWLEAADRISAAAYHRQSLQPNWVYLARKVPLERAVVLLAALRRGHVRGVSMVADSRRVYPSRDLACQVVGFVGVDGTGLAGIEKQYNDILEGKPGRERAERDARGNPMPGGIRVSEDPIDGKDIVLTIDSHIQYQAQAQLAATVRKYGAKSGSVVVMDPTDGSILAMASTPTFNPNDRNARSWDAVRNRPITDTYEPGSTIKAVTASAVIDRGLYTPSSMFDLPPTLRVGDRTIHEAHERDSVEWNLTQIVTQSSNVGAVMLGQKLGPRSLSDYFQRFGLLERTGVDFPGEVRGSMPPYGSWSSSTVGNVPFGQGVSTTVLQLARAIAAIGNKGILVTPHFLSSVRGDPSIRIGFTPRAAVSPKTAATMTQVMMQVVSDGTGKSAAVPGYAVAGKTGTAQKPSADGGYAKGLYVASFAGFLPAQDPKVLIVVTIDEPKVGSFYGGSVAGPMFSSLAGYVVSHLNIPPAAGSASRSATATVTSATVPGTIAKPVSPRGAAARTTATDSVGAGNGASTGDEETGPP